MSAANDKRLPLILCAALGKLYKLARDHYPNKTNVTVWCDSCGNNMLEECIGYDDVVLCLPCAETWSKKPAELHEQRQSAGPVVKDLGLVSLPRPHSSQIPDVSLMAQRMFRQ